MVAFSLDSPGSQQTTGCQARRLLRAHASGVRDRLRAYDQLAGRVRNESGPWVVTHGEPHAANVIRAGEARLLVDWDTVALAPPERDLWMPVVGGTDAAEIYVQETGTQLDVTALDFFRLTWDLKDLAEYLNVLRSPHQENEDTVRQYQALRGCAAIREEWAALLV